MSANPAAMQAMAAKYLALAGATTDARESEKLRQYAALYRDIAAQAIAQTDSLSGADRDHARANAAGPALKQLST
jgi:hypothetical protein